jgi:nitroreductase
MSVSDAVAQRASVRAFTSEPVSDETVRQLLSKASRSPSGGNVQPWKVYVVNGEATGQLTDLANANGIEDGEYVLYPPKLWEPHRTSRFALGEAMYDLLGIAREDKQGRFAQFAKNTSFFGAPVGVFCFIDRRMGQPQWSDLGMFMQTFMLLAEEAGLATCAQEYWAVHHQTVQDFVSAPEELMLFAGMALGHTDNTAKVNELQSQRIAVDDFATFIS